MELDSDLRKKAVMKHNDPCEPSTPSPNLQGLLSPPLCPPLAGYLHLISSQLEALSGGRVPSFT